MERNWYWRFVLVLALALAGAYYLIPSMVYFNASPEVRRSKDELKKLIPSWLPARRMNLGIDLQGGLHLVMGVDTEKALQDRADRAGDEIFEEMKAKGKPLKSVKRPGDDPEIEIVMNDSNDWDTLKELLDTRKGQWEVRGRSGTSVRFGMIEAYQVSLREDAVAQAQKTLRNRIDQYGVTEPEVRKRGSNSILIQIAGLTADEERGVKDSIIGKTAQLEFKMVDDESTYFSDLAKKGLPEGITLSSETIRGPGDALLQPTFLTGKEKAMLDDFIKKNPPPNDRVVRYQEERSKDATKKTWRTWLLDRKTPLTGDSLVNAQVAFDNDKNNYFVSMRFDQRGAVIFEKLTRENVKRRMAIVLDEIVDSAPVIEGPIPNGNASITLGGYKSQREILEDAKALSIVLKAGALPAPVYPQEERTVGSTLGEDAIQKGKLSVIATVLMIIILLGFYYRGSGVVAIAALGFNMTLLLAALAAISATLTLPGLAGLALTVGMAVDANIIQFERIREELRLGKTPRAAVDAGFEKSWSAIMDANVSTFLACIVLYQYGSGPIRGFATTLGLGVIMNTFTAAVVPRLLLEWVTRGMRTQQLSI
jgi:preprotein translocase subunit SecD